MATDRLTTVRLANLIPETWANIFLGYLPKYLNLINSVTIDFGEKAAKEGDIIHLHKRGDLEAKTKVAETDVTRQTPSDSDVPVTLDQHYEVTFSPEDVVKALAGDERGDAALTGYMEDAAMVLAEKVEDTIAAHYASAGDTVAGGAAVDLADLRSGRRKLVTAKVSPKAPLHAYLSEYAIEDLPLTDASVLGTNRPVFEGSIARLAGFNIFESQGVKTSGSPTTYHSLLYAQSAIGLALRPLPTYGPDWGVKQTFVKDPQTGLGIRVTMSYDANALAPQVTLDVLWGTAVLRAAHLIDLQHTG